MELTYILFVLVVLLNIITFVVFGIDKKRRKEGGDRISETTMFMLGMFGGSLGATLGMHYFHNKTHTAQFYLGMPALLLLHVVMVLVAYSFFM